MGPWFYEHKLGLQTFYEAEKKKRRSRLSKGLEGGEGECLI